VAGEKLRLEDVMLLCWVKEKRRSEYAALKKEIRAIGKMRK
jgi:hypothetical protein